jgi:hypothetical protein
MDSSMVMFTIAILAVAPSQPDVLLTFDGQLTAVNVC